MNKIRSTYDLVSEKRTNADLNTKVDPWNVFQDYYKKYRDTLFVTFTEIDKVGINVNSPFKTPLGIYSYPAWFVNDMGEFQLLPFASEAKYVNFFTKKSSANIIDVINVPDETVKKYEDECKAWFYLQNGIHPTDHENLSAEEHKKFIDVTHGYEIIQAEVNMKFHGKNKPGQRFWYLTYLITKKTPGKNAVLWNTLMRKYLGIDGVIDRGTGTIHSNEPYQAVFFSTSAITVIDRIPNVRVKDNAESRVLQRVGLQKRDLRNKYRGMTDDQLRQYLYHFSLFTNPSIPIQISAINIDVDNYRYIKNPTPEVIAAYEDKKTKMQW